MKYYFTKFVLTCFVIFSTVGTYGQTIDSTQIGKEYPYKLPFLGKQAYAKGYEIQKPLGFMFGTIFNKQGIVLNDFEMAIGGEDETDLVYKSLDGILDFGPSEGRINTMNFRADAWILPFLSVGAYFGKVWGEQTITFSLLGNENLISSTTDIRGQYYGLSVLGVAPLGPVALAVDYSRSWTTNENLDKPVGVNVAGIRVIRRIPTSKKGRFWAIWGGAQFMELDNQTSGNIAFDEALGVTEEDKQNMDNQWGRFTNGDIPNGNGQFWGELTPSEKLRHQAAYGLVSGLVDSTVYYKFIKELEYDYNMVLGFNYQSSPRWQYRVEYGFLKSKQQLMAMVSYRFGFKKKK